MSRRLFILARLVKVYFLIFFRDTIDKDQRMVWTEETLGPVLLTKYFNDIDFSKIEIYNIYTREQRRGDSCFLHYSYFSLAISHSNSSIKCISIDHITMNGHRHWHGHIFNFSLCLIFMHRQKILHYIIQ